MKSSAQFDLFARLARPVASDCMEMVVDGFAGFGGASEGIEQALGTAVDVAINHSPRAVELHQLNHPATRHYCQDIYHIDPREVVGMRRLGLAWFSPDCTHHSKARGGRPKSKNIRGLANRILLWCRLVRPRVIIMENVQEIQTWCRLDKRTGQPDKSHWGEYFLKFVRRLRQHGYQVEWNVLNAADYGAGTARHRLFLLARCDGKPIVWPEPTHGPGRSHPWVTAAECIDWTDLGHSIFLSPTEARKVNARRPLAEHTQRRIANGLARYILEAKQPFIIGIDNKSSTGSVWPAESPLRTITQENRFAMVSAFLSKYHGLKGNESRGQSLSQPIRTIDTQNRFALMTTFMEKPRIAGLGHAELVAAFLMKYYGTAIGQHLRQPLGTVTSRDRFGLVTFPIAGERMVLTDIYLRMLKPAELLRAQFANYADGYILQGSKAQQISGIGNSVPPHAAQALVAANYERRQA